MAFALWTVDAESAAVFGQLIESCLADSRAKEVTAELAEGLFNG
ncbi:hypothetical protein [Streptomyces sp. RT42]|nr:hypothetical protein [Streptomyces sp. RT42]